MDAAPRIEQRRRVRSLLLGRTALGGALAAGIAAMPHPGSAGPQGTVVVGGAVDVRQTGTHTEFTQATDTALLNHRSFDIGANESVNFAQPSAGALAVNRVVGSDLPTSIAGSLTANGNVWVLNPSGVAIRGTAQVNVGGLLATTASIGDEAILAGERSFAGAPAGSAVTNAGTISAGRGSVVLVAPVVSNTGTITTHGSDVALGAGSGFTVDFDGDGLTRFEVAPGSGVGLTNTGTISAAGGAAYISAASADDVQTSVVSIGGRVEATRVEERGGVIYVSGGGTGVTEVSGTLVAAEAAGDGGRIAVTGDRVDIRAGAVIDVSGRMGGAANGGTVEIGGGLRGAPIVSPVLARAGAQSGAPATAPLPTARRTVVRDGARIAASAGDRGDGGTVIVWADEATGFRGAVEAQGGALAGDGGFAEVSGRRRLAFDGSIDLGAPAGAAGTLLLDPDSVTIVAGAAGDAAEDAELDDRMIGAADVPAGFTISAGAVAQSVAAANTMIVATQSITQDAAVTLSGGNALTYRTETGDITLNAALTGPGNTLTIDAGGGVTLGDLALAGLDVTAGGAIAQGGATSIQVPGDTRLAAGSDITLLRPTNDFADEGSGHALRLQAPGSVRIADVDSVAVGASNGGSLEVAADDLAIVGALDFGGDVALTNAAGDLAIVGIAGPDGDLSTFEISDAEVALVQARRLVVKSGSGGIDVRGVTLDEGLALDAGTGAGAGPVAFTTAATTVAGDLSAKGASIAQDANGTLSVDGRTSLTATGTIVLASANDFAADGVDASGTAVTLADRNAITLGTIDAASLTVRAGGPITDAGDSAIVVSGQTDLTARNGVRFFDIALDEPGRHDFGGSVSALGEDIVLGDVSGIVLGAIGTNQGAPAGPGPDNPVAFYDDNGDGILDPSEPAAAGDLTVRAGGTIGDTGAAIDVAGRTRLESANGDIRLDGIDGDDTDRPHDFDSGATGDAVHEVDAVGRNVTLVDMDAIALGDIMASGDLSVTAGGSVTDTAGEAVVVGDRTTIVAVDPLTADPADDDFFDIALDNPGLHDLGSVDLTGEGIRILDIRDLAIVGVASRRDGAPDATLPDDGIFLEVAQGDFAFAVGPGTTPLDAVRDITLHAPNGSFESNAAVLGKDLPDGLTFRSRSGNITLDLQDGFVVQDVPGTGPFTLDARNGIARIRIGEAGEAEFFGIGTADFLEQARQPDFNPFFTFPGVGDRDLFRVTGDFALVARSPLTVRFQNTLGTANQGAGTVVLGTSFLGGSFDGISLFGTFGGSQGTSASLEGFRDAVGIGELSLLLEDSNTANGCAILVPTSCQPIGSLLPSLGYQDGLLLGLRFVAPTEDLDDPFTNRGDEEEWE